MLVRRECPKRGRIEMVGVPVRRQHEVGVELGWLKRRLELAHRAPLFATVVRQVRVDQDERTRGLEREAGLAEPPDRYLAWADPIGTNRLGQAHAALSLRWRVADCRQYWPAPTLPC